MNREPTSPHPTATITPKKFAHAVDTGREVGIKRWWSGTGPC